MAQCESVSLGLRKQRARVLVFVAVVFILHYKKNSLNCKIIHLSCQSYV